MGCLLSHPDGVDMYGKTGKMRCSDYAGTTPGPFRESCWCMASGSPGRPTLRWTGARATAPELTAAGDGYDWESLIHISCEASGRS